MVTVSVLNDPVLLALNSNERFHAQVRLIVVLDETGQANSTRFFDDGDTANTLDTKYYTLVNYQVANNTLSVTLPQKGYRGGLVLFFQLINTYVFFT